MRSFVFSILILAGFSGHADDWSAAERMDQVLGQVVENRLPWRMRNDPRDALLKEAAGLSKYVSHLPNFKSTELAESINQKMRKLLRRFYSVSNRRHLIEEIFNDLDLWSAEDLEVFAQRLRTGRLRYYIRPVLKALEGAQSGEIENFATEVRLSRSRSGAGDNWVGYMLVFKYNELRGDDVELFLRSLIVAHFKKSLITGEGYRLSDDPRRFKPEDGVAVGQLIEETISRIRTRISNQDPVWIAAVSRFKQSPNWRGRSFSNKEKSEIFKLLEWILGDKTVSCESAAG